MADKTPPKEYRKHHSFGGFYSHLQTDPVAQRDRCLRVVEEESAEWGCAPANTADVLAAVASDLRAQEAGGEAAFRITSFIADEMSLVADVDLPRYAYHRYRYDVFPQTRQLDAYPPYLQIEPASVCNFRCVFCYQTDPTFSRKPRGFMGTMKFELYRDLIDQCEGNVEFFSLASRGEPLICKELGKMLAYSSGKFLGMKINTNASLLTEEKAHEILKGGIRTVVFSADAAEEPTYSRLRVGGKLEKTLANIRLFQEVRQHHYPDLPLITRVSGVAYDVAQQSMEKMIEFWGDYVDQVAFVAYNPWENLYESPPSDVVAPCSDLWRRMFVWYDGKTNPCDTDYKSHLSPGSFPERSICDIWNSEEMNSLRRAHVEGERMSVEPCRRCVVV